MQLAYNEKGALGCGCLETEDTGLSAFGRVCIREIDEARMVVDLAHAGHTHRARGDRVCRSYASDYPMRTFGLCANIPRNAPDDVLAALAARGGVIWITAYAPFCEKAAGERPVLDDLIDHVAYVAETAGASTMSASAPIFFEGEILDPF